MQRSLGRKALLVDIALLLEKVLHVVLTVLSVLIAIPIFVFWPLIQAFLPLIVLSLLYVLLALLWQVILEHPMVALGSIVGLIIAARLGRKLVLERVDAWQQAGAREVPFELIEDEDPEQFDTSDWDARPVRGRLLRD